ncbi:MAG: type III secretion system chaperone [Pseudomonadota bacterium]
MFRTLITAFILIFSSIQLAGGQAGSPEEGNTNGYMSVEALSEVARRLDPNAKINGNLMQLSIQGVAVTIVANEKANRMRAFSPFKTLDGVDGQAMYRMMQANFDSALDARYAIARGHVIAVYIHPLKELQRGQFISGIGQVVNLVRTYGTAFTSGAVTYEGGDSNKLHQKLIEDLLKKGDKI